MLIKLNYKDMKNSNIKMKIMALVFLIISSMLFTINSYAQIRENKDVKINSLDFTYSIVSVEGDTAKHLVVELDRKKVKKVEKVHVKIGTSIRRGDIMASALDIEELKGNKTSEKLKVGKFDKDQIKLDLGYLEPGTYHIGLRIMDDKKDMYIASQKITI